MTGVLHVVGAGVSGLAAALTAARLGVSVRLYEAAPQPGGRCRTITGEDGFAHDNGTHVLLTANARALAFLDEIGSRADWIEPEPDGIPILDRGSGRLTRIGLSVGSWIDRAKRPEGLKPADLLRLVALLVAQRDRPVAACFQDRPLLDSFVGPLALAALNTSPEVASSRCLREVLLRTARPGAARLLVARRGLTPNLIEPALRRIRALGGEFRPCMRLRALETAQGRVTDLVFANSSVKVEPEDRVVLALPVGDTARLLPWLSFSQQHEAILNVHYRTTGPEAPRFLGLKGSMVHWVLARSDHVSVTVSAAGALIEALGRNAAERLWPEARAGLRVLGFAAPQAAPPARVLAERRATIRHAAGVRLGFPAAGLVNLLLAGDWGGPLPATIESAVRAGEAAARRACRLPRGWAPSVRIAAIEEAVPWSR